MTHGNESSRHKVLIVDDDDMIRLVMHEALEQAGFEVLHATDGAEALEKFETQKPDIILMDVEMPLVDGFAALEGVRSHPHGQHVPVVMVTGHDDTECVNRAYEAGATDFIAKPINWALLGHRLRYLLRANRTLLELRESESRLENAQRIAKLGHWDWDLHENRVDLSAEVSRILGLGAEKLSTTRENFLAMVHPDDRERVERTLQRALKQGTPYWIEHRLLSSDRSERVVHEQAELIWDERIQARRLSGTVQDITERRMAEERIQHLANYDELTGLPNRQLFIERLNETLTLADIRKRLLAILYIDLDRFKRINDTLGHSIGDRLLQCVARHLESCVRASDCVARLGQDGMPAAVARLGGDEFSVLLSFIRRPDDAVKVARRILNALAKPFDVEGHELTATPSIGIAVYPQDGQDVEMLLKNADTAMNHAKDAGRNNFKFYHNSMNAESFEELHLENSLRNALELQQFIVYYQPKIDIRNATIVGAEALLRWKHPELGLISPARFIPLAEETGLIVPIGAWVLDTACRQARIWQRGGFPSMAVAVNLSSRQFYDGDLPDVVNRVIERHSMSPSLLELELTESLVMQNAAQTLEVLRGFKDMGLVISMDDFGTGYSSLSYLKRFPLDTLKIDCSFIREIDKDPNDAAITEAIIALAHSLKLKVVAEGVETASALSFLTNRGCDEVQGYLFSRPVPAEALTRLMKNPTPLMSHLRPGKKSPGGV